MLTSAGTTAGQGQANGTDAPSISPEDADWVTTLWSKTTQGLAGLRSSTAS